MYLITKEYFIKKINVPNIEEHNSNEALELEISIDKYSRLFMQNILNNVLFSDLETYIIDGVLENTAPQKWLNLVNGCDYVKDGKTYTWKGLVTEEGLYKDSIIAYFVYLNHYQSTINTNLGQIVLEAKNALNQNPSEHLVSIYNDFVTQYQGKSCYEPKTYYVNGLYVEDYYTNSNSGYVSLLTFLKDNDQDYEGYAARPLEFKNRFGL